ncbi:MAG: NAD(P)/FAD-dependent oxidoreductase, partial [Thermoleophilia bacterium]
MTTMLRTGAPAGSDTTLRRRLVVIGNGMAGARAVEEILARGGGDLFDVTMIGDEPYGNYNRILLSGVLSGESEPRDIFINPLDWYDENGVTLRAGARVAGIDRDEQVVSTDDGAEVPYDLLILATGSRPFLPPIDGMLDDEGGLRPGIFAFRTIDDCAAIAAHARGCGRAAVIGGGLLGLEAARGLLTHDVAVEVVEAGPYLMGQQLDAEGGRILARTIEGMGIG